ncbi:MAG TPA: beta-galactosidase, partial [Tepidisphaeraceae bacterium]|nr:beta-galactosidase [Tepidisphaeraceae bacterium]
TGPDAGDYELMVCTESPTKSLWIDDIKFEPIRSDEAKLAKFESDFRAKVDEQRTKFKRVLNLLLQHKELSDDAYIKLGVSVAKRFIDRVNDNEQHPKQSIVWSLMQLEEIGGVLDDTEKRIRKSIETHTAPVLVPRPTGSAVELRDGIFRSDVTVAGKVEEKQPFYFAGYGHFDQVQKDLPNFPELGATMIQDGRLGPSGMNEDGSFKKIVGTVIETQRQAAANRIKVDYLLSPHYFPDWAMKQAPDLANGNAGFISYNIDHPKAREVNEKFIKSFMPKLMDSSSLLSVCLSNEPVYVMSGRDKYSLPKWTKYLQDTHKDIATLNKLYETKYEKFEDVPVPPMGMPKEVAKQRVYYDWCRFNKINFADWHGWLAKQVKEILPNVYTHSKEMVFFTMDRDKLHFGVDPELMTAVTDLAGCDAYAFPESATTYSWHGNEFWYDLLNSFRNQPVFNSENHVIADGSGPGHISPDITRSQFWQGGLHHQGTTTTWVWEELSDPSLSGSIYFRPGNIYGAGKAFLDLARFSPEVAAINRNAPTVALLYSPPSIFWEPAYQGTIFTLYTQLNYSGAQITFVSEKQLADGRTDLPPVIIVPKATHVSDAAVAALASCGKKIIRCSDMDMTNDEYHRPRQLPDELKSSPILTVGKDERENAAHLRKLMVDQGIAMNDLREADGEKLAWGIEYRVVPLSQRTLVPMINMSGKPQTVKLVSIKGDATDLLSGDRVDLNTIALDPVVPRLIEVQMSK